MSEAQDKTPPEPDGQQPLDQANNEPIATPLPHEPGDENAQPG